MIESLHVAVNLKMRRPDGAHQTPCRPHRFGVAFNAEITVSDQSYGACRAGKSLERMTGADGKPALPERLQHGARQGAARMQGDATAYTAALDERNGGVDLIIRSGNEKEIGRRQLDALHRLRSS